ncbi:MAG: hypothetical protein ABI977_21100 [Acidobacteriota bacterium]
MLNSMVTLQTNTYCRPTPRDLYQTCTGDKTTLLPLPAPAPASAAPRILATPANHCADCNAGGQMITAEKAAAICQCSRRLIYRWIDDGSLHFRELPDGSVLVCGVTLTAKLEQLEDATGFLSR